MPVPGYNSVKPMKSTTSNESTKYNLKSPKQNKQKAQNILSSTVPAFLVHYQSINENYENYSREISAPEQLECRR
jgi:hypothetical protein